LGGACCPSVIARSPKESGALPEKLSRTQKSRAMTRLSCLWPTLAPLASITSVFREVAYDFREFAQNAHASRTSTRRTGGRIIGANRRVETERIGGYQNEKACGVGGNSGRRSSWAQWSNLLPESLQLIVERLDVGMLKALDERLNLGLISFWNVITLGHPRLPCLQSRPSASIGQVRIRLDSLCHAVPPQGDNETCCSTSSILALATFRAPSNFRKAARW